MQHEPGDEYLRRIANFIRTHENGLAEAGLIRRRRLTTDPNAASVFNPLGWFTSSQGVEVPPAILSIDTHHLFYILVRVEALGINVGSLDVHVDNPARPMHYIDVFSDKSDALSLASFRSSLSAVSRLSLGPAWWGRPEPPSMDQEVKYIYSSFTKLPGLSLTGPGPKLIQELSDEPPNENALPLDVFKNLQCLECLDIDPRTILGWDRLAESLRTLTIKRSGLEDVSDIFVSAVLDDQKRRSENILRPRHFARVPSRQPSFQGTPLPEAVPEDDAEEQAETEPATPKLIPRKLSTLKWAFLRHLCLADNALTFFPTNVLPYLIMVTHLDLSSNLFVSVPEGLSALTSLISLNLADNMIDSVLGIYTRLGAITSLNLASNRVDSLCGLERLRALEKVDLRNNLIEEAAEVGRLATLPNITDVAVMGNPLVDFEEKGYRVAVFDLFWKEGKDIVLDGAPLAMYERRQLSPRPSQQMSSVRQRQPVARSPPVVAVSSPPTHAQKTPQKSSQPLPGEESPASLAAPVGKHRRRKVKRIVDLDGDNEDHSGGSRSHSRAATETRPRAKPPQKARSRPTSPERPLMRRHGRSRTEYVPAGETPQDNEAENQAEAYRARIEALRADMGDGWLKVFTQSQMTGTGVATG